MKHPALLLFVLVIACSPTASQPTGENTQRKPPSEVSFLFVQMASSGSFEPVAGSTNKYRLVLNDVSPSVVYFSDRPNRLAGQVSTTEFLEKIGFGGKVDPNAAIDIAGGAPDSDLIIAALTKPAYDTESRTLSYEIAILETPSEGLAIFSKRMDKRLPAQFGTVALFVDDVVGFKPHKDNPTQVPIGTPIGHP